jgi:hypothetical protein
MAFDVTELAGFGATYDTPPPQPILYPLGQLNFDPYAAAGNPLIAVPVEIHIFDGVILGSASVNVAALVFSAQWPSGTPIRVIFYGTGRVEGAGGAGGPGSKSAPGGGGMQHRGGGGGGGQGQLGGAGGLGGFDGQAGTSEINGVGGNGQIVPYTGVIASPGVGGIGGHAIEIEAGFAGTVTFSLRPGASGAIWGGGGGGGGGTTVGALPRAGGNGGVKGTAGAAGIGGTAGGAGGQAVKLNGAVVSWDPAQASFDVWGSVA